MKWLVLILLCPVIVYGQLSQKTIATDTLKGRSGGKMVFRDTAKFNWITSGSVPWIGSDKTLRQNNTNFKWDSTNTRLIVGGVVIGQGGTAQVQIDGTDGSESAGTDRIYEAGGGLNVSGRDLIRFGINNDNTVGSNVAFSVLKGGLSGTTIFSVPETSAAFVRASTGWRGSRNRAFEVYDNQGRFLSGIVSDSNLTGAFTATGWKAPFYGNAVSEGGMWSDEEYQLSAYQHYDTTSLASSVSPSDTTLTVLAVPSGFGPGRNVMVGTLGTDMDVVQVRKIVGTTYYLDNGFQYAHTSGTLVYPYRWRGANFAVKNWWQPNGTWVEGASLFPSEATPSFMQTFDKANHVRYFAPELAMFSAMVISGGVVSALGTPGMAVNVDSGVGLRYAYNISGANLPQYFLASGQYNVTIPAADNDSAFIALVYWDSVGVVKVLAGSLAPSAPTIPSTPSGGTALAAVTVAAGATSISAGNISDVRQLSLIVSSFTVADQRRNFNVVSTSQARDTSSSFFSFDASSKPLFNINGKDGNQILGLDSVGAMTIGEDASLVNPRRAQASLVLTPPYSSVGRAVEAIIMPTGSNGAALRSYVAPSGVTSGLTSPAGSITASTNALSISAGGYDSAAWAIGSNINLNIGNKWTTTSHPSYMTFNVNPTGSTTRSEVMRIDTSLNVGIGDATPLYKLTVGNGDLFGVTSAGAVAKVNGGTAEGDGVISTPDTVNWTGIGATTSAVNFSNTAAGHTYTFEGTLIATTGGTSGNATVTIAYNNGTAVTWTSSAVTFGTTGADVDIRKTFYNSTGTPTILVTVTSPVGSPVVALRGALKRIW